MASLEYLSGLKQGFDQNDAKNKEMAVQGVSPVPPFFDFDRLLLSFISSISQH